MPTALLIILSQPIFWIPAMTLRAADRNWICNIQVAEQATWNGLLFQSMMWIPPNRDQLHPAGSCPIVFQDLGGASQIMDVAVDPTSQTASGFFSPFVAFFVPINYANCASDEDHLTLIDYRKSNYNVSSMPPKVYHSSSHRKSFRCTSLPIWDYFCSKK